MLACQIIKQCGIATNPTQWVRNEYLPESPHGITTQKTSTDKGNLN
jgi:hypothetical protein